MIEQDVKAICKFVTKHGNKDFTEAEKELESKEILELLKTTTRSFDEIKAFLKGENTEEEG